ncbi:hypothetical protein [Sphingobacterium haloxyli]|nr:hypothetical protein [Sphingobacterium haloxyli]
MITKTTKILAAKLCFAIFMTKMLISATPMFVNILDQGTILQVVLQLEIENAAKGNNASEDLHEASAKLFTTTSDYLSFCPVIENLGKEKRYLKNEGLFSVFHPSVPPPPPNS